MPAAAAQGEGEGAADAEADAARSETLSLLQARVAEDRQVWRDGTQPLSDEDKARRRDRAMAAATAAATGRQPDELELMERGARREGAPEEGQAALVEAAGAPEGDPLGRKRQARALQRWRRLSLLLALAVVYLLLGGGDGDDCDDTPSVGPSPDGLTVHGCVCKGQTTIDGWFDDETFDGCGWAEHQGASTDPPFSACGASP